ncbi:hypothetical protein CVP04_07270 [Caviibacterium pharyngocola]|uniref:Uncharacterized protein n=1 Tax=Caviibacterium pharyngocola TaxID=28159 RepID=A0A2M8RW93_9PAST|nr:hypothetical protein CVP04_07270 [Caviibacterium pharyngocola]
MLKQLVFTQQLLVHTPKLRNKMLKLLVANLMQQELVPLLWDLNRKLLQMDQLQSVLILKQ